jgi:hypothetical protein
MQEKSSNFARITNFSSKAGRQVRGAFQIPTNSKAISSAMPASALRAAFSVRVTPEQVTVSQENETLYINGTRPAVET